MKALSIRQPYAWLIVNGIKDIENRTWFTGYRGPVLIHAGKAYPKREFFDDYDEYCERGYPSSRDSMVGGIVGIATITACVQRSDSRWFNGPYGFTMTEAKACPLVPCVGALGFFEVPDDVMGQLPAAWASARKLVGRE